MLDTVDALVEAIGGTAATASLAKVGAPAVSMWRAAGSIPSRHFLVFSEELQRRGLDFDRRIFGFNAPAEEAHS